MGNKFIQFGTTIFNPEHIVSAKKVKAVNSTTGEEVGWFYVRITLLAGRELEFQKDYAVEIWNLLKDMSLPRRGGNRMTQIHICPECGHAQIAHRRGKCTPFRAQCSCDVNHADIPRLVVEKLDAKIKRLKGFLTRAMKLNSTDEWIALNSEIKQDKIL